MFEKHIINSISHMRLNVKKSSLKVIFKNVILLQENEMNEILLYIQKMIQV